MEAFCLVAARGCCRRTRPRRRPRRAGASWPARPWPCGSGAGPGGHRRHTAGGPPRRPGRPGRHRCVRAGPGDGLVRAPACPGKASLPFLISPPSDVAWTPGTRVAPGTQAPATGANVAGTLAAHGETALPACRPGVPAWRGPLRGTSKLLGTVRVAARRGPCVAQARCAARAHCAARARRAARPGARRSRSARRIDEHARAQARQESSPGSGG